MPKPSPRPLRWGILGCGRITERGLIPGIAQSASSRLDALASRDLAKATDWAKQHGVARAYGSYAELVDDPEIDAVYVPLPNEQHLPWTVAAADAGKHVLCEKPLALDAAEAEKMVAHCRDKGVLLMEAFMWRHQPRTIELSRLVRAGAIGKLQLIRSSFSFPIDVTDWRLEADRGGGALWDIGTYGVSTARLFAGTEPESISAHARLWKTGVDMTVAALLRFPDDVFAQIDCSFEQPFRCAYELVGDSGAIAVPDAYLPPEPKTVAYIRERDGETREFTFDGRNQYACMVDAFADAVRAGALADPAENGLAQMRVLNEIRNAFLAAR